MCRKIFSRTTTELSIRRENASARPLNTMLLIVLSAECKKKNVASTDSGMERNTATVARGLPRKSKIISPVSNRPMLPSFMTVEMACFTKSDWSKTTCVFSCAGISRRVLIAVRDSVDHCDRVGVSSLLQNRHVNRFLAVDAHDVVLNGGAVHGLADIGDEYRSFALRSSAGPRSTPAHWLLARWCRCCNPSDRCAHLPRARSGSIRRWRAPRPWGSVRAPATSWDPRKS